MALSIEEKYDEVRQLITLGKEKGYLLYEEVNDMLPAEISSSDELDDIFSMFGSMGIEVRDLVVFNEEEITEDKIENKIRETLKLIDKVAHAHKEYLGYRKHFLKI